ncbi:MAG TPA: hypothetical protein VGN20_02980 [Mucilaginibacter sp.]|jgi:hypothetical protein
MSKINTFLLSIVLLFSFSSLKAQDNYEIQVYGSETVEAGHTMFELHSNYTSDGSKTVADGELPTNHVFHETIEITHGWTPWFETGFYFFNSIGNDGRTAYVGSHIRPRVAAPESWNWPVGVSLSLEFGFQKAAYSANTATLEIRPIIDKKWGRNYFSLNPTLEQSFKGPDENRGLIFSPNVKWSYDATKVIALGLEYYGSTGPFFKYDPIQEQEHQLFIATDLSFNPKWEFNAGYGWGLTNATDNGIFKVILGRRF